ncbi:MAG: hypothetical protein PVH37_26260 [Desulfobacterales bacterium]|jgi:hypothetical protein
MGAKKKKISDIPQMDDKSLEKFWDKNQPEDFDGWKDVSFKFKRPPKKLVHFRLEPGDVRIIDRESKKTGIDRAQLVRAWVKEKIRELGY